MNTEKLNPGDDLVCLLDKQCTGDFEEMLQQDDDIGRALVAWHTTGVSRFAVVLMTDFQMIGGKRHFSDSALLTFRDADELLKAMPGLAKTSGGSLWLTFLMDDVETQVHALLDGARVLN